jgi:predicted CxxxxCH...CXXCH cytochrome family protein
MLAVGCGAARSVDGRRCTSQAACEEIHPAGINDPMSADFHGKLLESSGWNLATCARCHGADLSGGMSARSCLTCHAPGRAGCTSCHGAPPATGAHVAHARKYDCAACHTEPSSWTDPGHLRLRALVSVPYDGVRCSATYCHGDATPAWNGGPGEAACGSCHGLPPANHASNRCGDCHGRVADNQARIIDDSLHATGRVSLGDDSGTCGACHPTPGGAHASHTMARHELSRPIVCSECHVVPTALDSPGHIDHARAPVFPDGGGPLARARNAMPSWDGTRCSGTYCHGDATPTWVPGNGAASCGACHGIPPASPAHQGVTSLQSCVQCHHTTIDPSGAIIVGGTHLDGVVNVGP